MKKDSIARFYDRLTPEERLRLLLEARARGDWKECRNLEWSCPKRNYVMNDVAYQDRVMTSKEITLSVCLDLAPRLARLRMLGGGSDVVTALGNTVVQEAHSAYFRGRMAGEATRRTGNPQGRTSEPPDPDLETELDLEGITSRVEEETVAFADRIGRLERVTRLETAAIWEAFSRFSRSEIGVGPETLLGAWFGPMLAEIEAIGEAPESAEAVRDKADEYESDLGRW